MNTEIINQLQILADYYKKSNDKFRERAYKNALISLKSVDYKLVNEAQLKKAKIKGIGKSIEEKIIEYLNTGRIEKVEEVKINLGLKRGKREEVEEIFNNIWGVGPVKAKELYDSGFRNLDQLRKDPSLLTTAQQVGLKHYEDLLKKIKREDITTVKLVLKYLIRKNLTKNFKLDIAGSYRRGMESSGDIDCLITSKNFTLPELVKMLQRAGFITDILSMKEEKFMGVAHCPSNIGQYFRFDIEFVPENEYASALLYFTGSQQFNIAMRFDAKKQGYVLNQHGLFKNLKLIPTSSEREIFDKLGLVYVDPSKR